LGDGPDWAVAAGAVRAHRRADVAEVRLVDGDDVVGEVVAQGVDLGLRDQIVGRLVLGTRDEFVVRVVVEGRVEAAYSLGAADPAVRNVDVDRRAVRRRTGVRQLEALVAVSGMPVDTIPTWR
jgi:hypothetical protein